MQTFYALVSSRSITGTPMSRGGRCSCIGRCHSTRDESLPNISRVLCPTLRFPWIPSISVRIGTLQILLVDTQACNICTLCNSKWQSLALVLIAIPAYPRLVPIARQLLANAPFSLECVDLIAYGAVWYCRLLSGEYDNAIKFFLPHTIIGSRSTYHLHEREAHHGKIYRGRCGRI